MQIPAQITFHNMDPSAALEARVQEKIAKLDRRFNGLVGCHVVVEASHHHQNKGRLYTARIDVTLPKGELVVSHHPGKNPIRHEKAFAAMNDAFLAIEKQLSRFRALQREKVKQHVDNWQSGVVSNIVPDDGYGFMATIDGLEVYFHRNAVSGDHFDKLDIGTKVSFVLAEGEGHKGPQASFVRVKPRKQTREAG